MFVTITDMNKLSHLSFINISIIPISIVLCVHKNQDYFFCIYFIMSQDLPLRLSHKHCLVRGLVLAQINPCCWMKACLINLSVAIIFMLLILLML